MKHADRQGLEANGKNEGASDLYRHADNGEQDGVHT